MLHITCPWCGPRAQTEFAHGGDAAPQQPGLDASESAWYESVYIRRNPRGAYLEYWQHSHGCRRWFKAVRDTLTHEIFATGDMDLTPPEGGA